MKTKTIAALAIAGMLLLTPLLKSVSQEASQASKDAIRHPRFEYATARFMAEKTSIVWPDGSVENVMALSGKSRFDNGNEKYPKGSDYRMYWLTVAMNLMGKRGFELAHLSDADVVMKRQIAK